MKRYRLGLTAISLICAALVMVSQTARADDTAKAKEIFKQAEQQFADGNYTEANKLYQEAYALKPLPGFHLNIGQCYRKLGDCNKAIEHYRLYLESSQNPKHRADVTKLIEVCEKELAAQPPPEPAPVDEPPPDIEQKPEPKPEPGPEPSRKRFRPMLFWTGVGVTGVLLLTGTITGAVALSKSSKFRDLDTPREDLQDLKDSGTKLRTTSTVTFVLGAATAAATTVLFFYTDFGPKETSVAAAPVEGGGVVVLGGRF